MKKLALILLSAVLFTSSSNAQITRFTPDALGGRPMMSDGDGKPLYLRTTYVAEGSPYLYEEYSDAELTTMAGQVYKNVKVKINLLEKLFLFKTPEGGVEMEITTPIRSIHFYATSSGNAFYPERTIQGYQQALNAPGATVYEILAEDSAALLLKKITVTYIDTKPYGEATTTRTFKKTDSYFAAVPPTAKDLQKIERNKTAVAALFGNKSAAVTQFIADKKLKCKSDEDLVEVFRYYNSL